MLLSYSIKPADLLRISNIRVKLLSVVTFKVGVEIRV